MKLKNSRCAKIVLSTVFLLGIILQISLVVFFKPTQSSDISLDDFSKISTYLTNQRDDQSSTIVEKFPKIDDFIIYRGVPKTSCSQVLIDLNDININPDLFKVEQTNEAKFFPDSNSSDELSEDVPIKLSFHKTQFGMSTYTDCPQENVIYTFYNNTKKDISSHIVFSYLDKNQKIIEQDDQQITFPKKQNSAIFGSENISPWVQITQIILGVIMALLLIGLVILLKKDQKTSGHEG